MHGTTMIFLFVVPMMAGLRNYFVPLMIGARDVAFPRLNALSYWLFLAGGIVFYLSVFWSPPEAGWIATVPLASETYLPSGGIDAWIYLVHLTGTRLTARGDQLLRDDRQHASARDELVAAAALHLVDPRLLVAADHRDPGARGVR
jgi:heme/copper-type cytochrome/quinol oxidase subunit 1